MGETATAATETTVATPPKEDDEEDDDDDDDEDPLIAVAPTVGPNTQARLASLAGNPDPSIVTRVPPSTEPVEGWEASRTTGGRTSIV